MPLPEDLLEQAWHLARRDLHKPRQASLRRAISTAYYALFHKLIADASHRFSRAEPSLQSKIARTLSHTEMRKVCRSIAEKNLSDVLKQLLRSAGFSPETKQVAKTFVDLQERRHEADYDLAVEFSRAETFELLDRVESAFAGWQKVHNTEEANIFLAALLFAGRWSR